MWRKLARLGRELRAVAREIPARVNDAMDDLVMDHHRASRLPGGDLVCLAHPRIAHVWPCTDWEAASVRRQQRAELYVPNMRVVQDPHADGTAR